VAAEIPEVWRINNHVNLRLVGKINDLGKHRTLLRAGAARSRDSWPFSTAAERKRLADGWDRL